MKSAVEIVKNMMEKCNDLEFALLSYRNMPNKYHKSSSKAMTKHLISTLPVTKKMSQIKYKMK